MAKRLNSSGNVVRTFKKYWFEESIIQARNNWSDNILHHMSFADFWGTVNNKL